MSPDMDFETNDPPAQSKNSSFGLQTLMELQRSHGALTNAVENLTKVIEKQSTKLDGIEMLRSDVRDLSTRLTIASTEISDTKGKLDRVRLWIAGVGGVVFVLGIGFQIALHFWPATAPTAVAPIPINLTVIAPPGVAAQSVLAKPTAP